MFEKKADGWTKLVEVPGEKASLSPNGKLVAMVGWTTERKSLVVRLFAVDSGREQWSAPVDSYGLHGFTPDGRYVIQRDNAGHRFFDAATGKQAALASNGSRCDSQGPEEVAYRDGWVAAVIRRDSKVELVRWDLTAGKESSRAAIKSPLGGSRTPPFGSPRLAVMRAVEDHPVPGRKGASWSSTTVEVYDPAATEPLTVLRLGTAATVIATPDGGTLAVVGHVNLSFYSLPADK